MNGRKKLAVASVCVLAIYVLTLAAMLLVGQREFRDINKREKVWDKDVEPFNAEYDEFVNWTTNLLGGLLTLASFLLSLSVGLSESLVCLFGVGAVTVPMVNVLPDVYFPGDSYSISFFFITRVAAYTVPMVILLAMIKLSAKE